MALYRMKSDGLEAVPETSFEDEGVKERADLQRLLRDQPDVLEAGLFIVAEEYGDWEESRRRIDLLALDRDGRLVVIELKRTEDGGFMELQAIRYAAMVANMTFEQAVDAHREYLGRRGRDGDAHEIVRRHLQAEEDEEPEIDSQKPRILLVSGDFSRELATSVLWLNDSGLDVRCIRLQSYKNADALLVDVTQVLPLPEAQDYLVRVRERVAEAEAAGTARRRERTIHILVREGVVAPGTRIVFHAGYLIAGATVDLADKKFHARISDEPTARDNVVWDFDGERYSLSALSVKLRDEHGVSFGNYIQSYPPYPWRLLWVGLYVVPYLFPEVG